MQIPLYFLNKDELSHIEYTIELYQLISKEYPNGISDDTRLKIMNKLNKRECLNDCELINLSSTMTMVIICAEVMGNPYEVEILNTKYALLKLLSTHIDEIAEDVIADNYSLFTHIYLTLSSSIDLLDINEQEKNTYNFLKLLQL